VVQLSLVNKIFHYVNTRATGCFDWIYLYDSSAGGVVPTKPVTCTICLQKIIFVGWYLNQKLGSNSYIWTHLSQNFNLIMVGFVYIIIILMLYFRYNCTSMSTFLKTRPVAGFNWANWAYAFSMLLWSLSVYQKNADCLWAGKVRAIECILPLSALSACASCVNWTFMKHATTCLFWMEYMEEKKPTPSDVAVSGVANAWAQGDHFQGIARFWWHI
jgi:hypothetical protein